MVKRIRSLSGVQQSDIEFNVNANQTIYRGDLVYLSNGKISLVGPGDTKIVGIAQADIKVGQDPTPNDKIPVDVINEFTLLELDYAGTLTSNMMGNCYKLTESQYVDSGVTSGGVFIPLSFDNNTFTTRGVIATHALWYTGRYYGNIVGDVTGNITGKVFGTTASYSASGTISSVNDVVFLSGASAALSMGLDDGISGQIIKIRCTNAAYNCVVTPAHFSGGTTITFDAAGKYAELIFTDGNWNVVFTTATIA